MKLSDRYNVDKLCTERSDLKTKLYNVEHPTENRFYVSFMGTTEGGEVRDIAAAALVPFFRREIRRVETDLRAYGVTVDQ